MKRKQKHRQLVPLAPGVRLPRLGLLPLGLPRRRPAPAPAPRNNEPGSAAGAARSLPGGPSPSPEPNGAPRAGRARRPPARRPGRPPPSAPQLGGDPGLARYKGARSWGAGRGRLRSGTDAPPRRPPPARRPSITCRPVSASNPPIKVHFGRRRGLRRPRAPPGGSGHFAPRELSGPGGGGGSRAWPPLPPGGGLAVPPNGTCGSPQADIFFAEAASAPRSARLRIPPRREELGLTPSSPARARRPPPAPPLRGSGAGAEGAGRSRRERGGAAAGRWTKPAAGRGGPEPGWRGGAGAARRYPARTPPPGPRERDGGLRGAGSSCSRSGRGPRSGAARTPLRAHLEALPGPPARGLSACGCGSRARGGARGGCARGEGTPGRLGPHGEPARRVRCAAEREAEAAKPRSDRTRLRGLQAPRCRTHSGPASAVLSARRTPLGAGTARRGTRSWTRTKPAPSV